MSNLTQSECQHEEVLVDYSHPYGIVCGVRVAELQASDLASTRSIMVLLHPRCAKCGAKLQRNHLESRICKNGDLHDQRFRWE